MKLHSAVTSNKQTLEYGAYVRIDDDTRFPPVSSEHHDSPFPHYAILTKNIDMLPGLSIPLMNNDTQTYVQKYGYTHDLDANTNGLQTKTIWTGEEQYPWDALNSPVSITATSESETDTAQIVVNGLDAQWNQQTRVITLSGADPISIDGQWRRVFRAHVTGPTAIAGDVTIKTATSGNVIAHIPVEEQQTLMALYTVPRGYTAYMTGFNSTVSRNEDMLFRLRIREPGSVFRTQHIAQVYQTPYHYRYEVYKQIDEMCDIECTGEPTNNNVAAHAAFDLILIKNN